MTSVGALFAGSAVKVACAVSSAARLSNVHVATTAVPPRVPEQLVHAAVAPLPAVAVSVTRAPPMISADVPEVVAGYEKEMPPTSEATVPEPSPAGFSP